MDLMMSSLVMSRLDLAVLLLAAKKDRICSLALPAVDEIDDYQMIKSIFELSRDGLLDIPKTLDDKSKTEDFRPYNIQPSKEAMEYIKPLIYADKVVLLVPYNKEMDQKFIYIYDKLVTLVEADYHQKGRLRITSFAQKNFEEWIRDEFDLEKNLADTEDASNEYTRAIDQDDIERENLKAVRRPDGSSLTQWMEEAYKSSKIAPLFAMMYMRSGDAQATRYRMMLRGKFAEWCIECIAGDILSGHDEMEVWPSYENMWVNI